MPYSLHLILQITILLVFVAQWQSINAFVIPHSKISSRNCVRIKSSSELSSNRFNKGRNELSFSCLKSVRANSDNSENELDNFLSRGNLKQSINVLRSNPDTEINKSRFLSIFKSIETRTKEAEENFLSQSQQRLTEGEAALIEYPPISPARSEMTDMYYTLKHLNHLRLFGAAGNNNYPAGGSKTVTQPILEETTNLSMSALTPKPTNTLLFAGAITAALEGVISLVTGIDLNVFVFCTILIVLLDNILVNGAVFESFQKILMPEYTKKIIRHEAGHFLIAYLLGCPVEGCVLSTWEALKDERFGGSRTGVSAGTSFFDEQLSNQVNGRMPLSRSTIDRYTTIVMGGIAAEAVNYGGADGGASDEMALIRFLTQISPRGGSALAWNAENIRNQARWGAMQAVLLLRHYKSSYEALVEVLERGGDLGECVWAIEKAAVENNTDILKNPLGIILEKGLYGEWIQDTEKIKEISKTIQPEEKNLNLSERPLSSSSLATKPNEIIESKEDKMDIDESQEFLRTYRETMEQKLREIDMKLESLNETD